MDIVITLYANHGRGTLRSCDLTVEVAKFSMPQIKRRYNVFPICPVALLCLNRTTWIPLRLRLKRRCKITQLFSHSKKKMPPAAKYHRRQGLEICIYVYSNSFISWHHSAARHSEQVHSALALKNGSFYAIIIILVPRCNMHHLYLGSLVSLKKFNN